MRTDLFRCQLLPNRELVKNHLKDKQIYRKLKLFFRTKRYEIDDKHHFDLLIRNWRFKKIIFIFFLINFLIENDRTPFLSTPSIDNLINLKARYLRKPIKSLETVDEQCSLLDSLEPNKVISFLNLTLDHYFIELTRKQQVDSNDRSFRNIDTLIEQWKCGTLNLSLNMKFDDDKSIKSSKQSTDKSNRIDKQFQTRQTNSLNDGKKKDLDQNERKDKIKRQEIQLINQFFQKQLIEKRNTKISEMISNELKTNKDKNLLFVIGSAHFISIDDHNGTILKHLESNGYQLVRINRTIRSL